MKVALFAPYALWTPHAETDLEIAEQHLAAGDEVVWFGCRRDFGSCEPNPDNDRSKCFKCMGRAERGLGMLSGAVIRRSHLDYLTPEDEARVAALPGDFANRGELEAVTLDGFDLGTGVLSSIIWMERDAQVDYPARREQIRTYLADAARIYLAMRNYLRAHPTDRLYLFNGRMAHMRAVMRACADEGVSFDIHERGCDLEHYSLSRDAMWHEISACDARIRAAWASPEHSEEEKHAVAERFYQQRAKGRIGYWHSFTEAQVEGTLPEGFDPAARNIAIYTSSEYEFAAIDKEWDSPISNDPFWKVTELLRRALEAAPDVRFYVRLHPTPDGSDKSSTAAHMAIDLPNATILPPDSSVCTYALLHACEKVVVTGSTVGIEAAFWGKPAVLGGRILWEKLGSAYTPGSFDEFLSLVLDPDLAPLDPLGARMYGYYLATFGERFEHYEPTGVTEGRFKGRKLQPTFGYAMRARIARLLRPLLG